MDKLTNISATLVLGAFILILMSGIAILTTLLIWSLYKFAIPILIFMVFSYAIGAFVVKAKSYENE